MNEETMVVLRWLFKLFHDVRVGELGATLRLTARDNWSNWIMKLLHHEGYQFFASTNPETDKYHIAVANMDDEIVLRDTDLGLDFRLDHDIAEDYWERT